VRAVKLVTDWQCGQGTSLSCVHTVPDTIARIIPSRYLSDSAFLPHMSSEGMPRGTSAGVCCVPQMCMILIKTDEIIHKADCLELFGCFHSGVALCA
jgi:hypothetical protein